MRVCSATTAEGTLWPVDAALRPEGKAGPAGPHPGQPRRLLRALGARPGSSRRCSRPGRSPATSRSATAYVDAVAPLVWQAAERAGLRRGRAGDAPPGRGARSRPTSADRELKLGPGGLRDVEFAVQLLQLVHGRADETLRSRHHAGRAARRWPPAATSAARTRAELDARVPVPAHASSTGCSCTGCAAPTCCPTADDDLRWLGRSLGLRGPTRSASCSRSWRQHAREVRRLHEKLFYRPLLAAVARLPADEARLTPEAARGPAGGARLRRPGRRAAPPRGADRRASSRRAAIQRTLLPVLLGWFADAPDPDAGLLAFRQVCDALGTTPWYLRLLRDEGAAAAAAGPAARVAAGYAADLLAAGARGGAAARRRRRAAARATAAALRDRGRSPRSRRHDDPAAAVGGRPRRCAAASCSGSPPPTCSGCVDVDAGRRGADRRRRGRGAGGALDVAVRAVESARRRRAADAARGRSPWAGSAGASWATPPTPTCCSSTSRVDGADERAAHRGRARGRRASCAGCSRCRRPTRRSASTPTCAPRAGRARWCARSASYARLLRALVAGLGGAGAAAGRAGRRRRRARRSGSSALVDPLRYPPAG